MKKILKENPDSITLYHPEFNKIVTASWKNSDSHVFGYFNNKLYGTKGEYTNHILMGDTEEYYFDKNGVEPEDIPYSRDKYKYAGRLWKKSKIISFWDYPKKNLLYKIMSDLNKRFKDLNINDEWWIEIIDKNNKYSKPKLDNIDKYDYSEFKKIRTNTKYDKLVKIKDYVGSDKQIGKEIQHNISPMLKNKTSVPKGVGSRKPVPGAKSGELPVQTRFRTRKGLGDGIIRLKDLITENPDKILISTGPNRSDFKVYSWWHADSWCFGYYKKNNKFYIANRTDHGEIFDIIKPKELEKDGKYPQTDREDFDYSGRLWENDKIISFWDYPKNYSELNKIVKDINKSGVPFKIDNSWNVEVIDKGNKYDIPKYYKNEYNVKYWQSEKSKFILVKDYKGSEKQLDKTIKHILSPIDPRKKTNLPKGVGSEKPVPGAKHGESPVQTKFRTRSGLGDGIIKLKKLIGESEIQLIQNLDEGVYDPGILKAFFTAGGPGSGKTYVTTKAGMGKFSPLGIKVVNSDEQFERKMKEAGLELTDKNIYSDEGQRIRGQAKITTDRIVKNYFAGRLGVLIDGTGKNYGKILKNKKTLEMLGYDTHMLFIDTTLEVALKRNEQRPRNIERNKVIDMWKEVQENKNKFKSLFGSNFIYIDGNTADDAIFLELYKTVKGLVNQKIKNKIGQQWVKNELEARKR